MKKTVIILSLITLLSYLYSLLPSIQENKPEPIVDVQVDLTDKQTIEAIPHKKTSELTKVRKRNEGNRLKDSKVSSNGSEPANESESILELESPDGRTLRFILMNKKEKNGIITRDYKIEDQEGYAIFTDDGSETFGFINDKEGEALEYYSDSVTEGYSLKKVSEIKRDTIDYNKKDYLILELGVKEQM